MVESRGSRVAVAGASIVLGAGAMVAERAIGLDVAFAGTNSVNSEHIRTAPVNPALPEFGGKLVFSNGQFAPKLGPSDDTAEISSSHPQPGDPGYKKYVSKQLKKLQSCKYTVNLVPNGADSTQISNKKKMTGSFIVPKNGNTSYSYRLLNGARYCGRYAFTKAGNIVFPNVARKKTSGKIVDKNGMNSPNGYKSVIFFGK